MVKLAQDRLQELSKRGDDWWTFSVKLLEHVESYTVPQYGDKGEDQCTEFTAEDFRTQIKKYVNRMGRVNGGSKRERLDLMKICHYSQMLHDLMEKEGSNEA